MSKTITPAQLNDNTKTYSIDQFRSMVNYVNTKNKGYVRFQLTNDGLKLEKFNNKIDFPLFMRSNTSAAHNKAIREKFLGAMQKDLKYMGAAGETIRRLIISPKEPGEAANLGKALSRLDVKAVFEKFDAYFNDGAGRMTMVKTFLTEAKAKCGFDGSDDEFLRDYLRTGDIGIDYRYTDYITRKENVDGLPPNQRMVKSEVEFRNFLGQLEGLVDAAKMRVQTENTLKSIATSCVARNGDFGVTISENDLSVVRASLIGLLDKAGVQDVDLGFGHTRAGLEMFLKNVLPIVVRQGVENLREFANLSNQDSVNQVLDADFNIDRILSLATDFINGAKNALAAEAPDGKTGEAARSALEDLTANVVNKAKATVVFVRAREVFILNMHGGKGENVQRANDVSKMTEDFIREAKLDLFTANFVKDRFMKFADKVAVPDGKEYVRKAEDCINKIRVAGQLNFGERWKVDPNAAIDRNLQLQSGGNAQKFLKEVSDKTVLLVNEKGGGLPMYENLISRALPAILVQKIRNSVASGGAARVNIDEKAYDDVMARLKTVRDIYCNFRDGKGAVLMEKSLSAFKRQLDRLLKKGNIDQTAYNTLYADYVIQVKDAMKRAVERFFALVPPSAQADAKDTEANGLRQLETFFNEEKGEVLADMRQRIATSVVTLGFAGNVRTKLLNELDVRVKECAQKLKDNGVTLNFTDEGTTLTTALTKLYYKVLAGQCERGAIAGKRLDDKFVTKVVNAFYDAAVDLVKNTNKLAKILDDDLKIMRQVATDGLFEQQAYAKYKTDLPKDEFAALKASMDADLAVSLQTKVDALKNRFLRNPEAYSKKNVGDFQSASELFPEVGKDGLYTEDSVDKRQYDIVNERLSTVQNWLYPDGVNGKRTLAGDMITSESSRIKEKFATVPENERYNIIERAVREVLAMVDKYPLSYATGGYYKFINRVYKEVQALVDKHAASQAAFREKVIKDAGPVMDKYNDMLKTADKSGREVAEAKLLQVLDSISREKEPPKAAGFATAFDGMLNKLFTDNVDMKMDEFLAYSAKVSAAYEKCVPAFNKKLLALAKETLPAVGATEADVKFVEEKLMPVFRNKLEIEIQKAPDHYNGKNAVRLAELTAEEFVGDMESALKNMNLSDGNNYGLKMMLDKIGLRSLLYVNGKEEEATIATTKTAVATWMSVPEVKTLIAETRQAELTLAAYGLLSPSEEAKSAKAKVEEFRSGLRNTVMGLKSELLDKAFKSEQVVPALQMFKVWLKQYVLPPVTVVVDGIGSVSLEKAALLHFHERIAKMQVELASNPDTKEPLLSAQYLSDFVTYLNKLSRNVIYTEIHGKLLNSKVDEIINNPANADVYNVRMQHGDSAEAQVRRDVTTLNLFGLTNQVNHVLDKAKKLLKEYIVTLEDMKRWDDVIIREFTNLIKEDAQTISKYNEYAISRMNMMTAIDLGIVSGRNAVELIVKDVLKEYFGGTDILDLNQSINQKFLADKDFSVVQFVGTITDMVHDEVKNKVKALKDMAMEGGKPGSSLEPLPDRAKLKAIFRDVAKQTVKTLAGMKNNLYAQRLSQMVAKVKSDYKSIGRKDPVGQFKTN